MQAVALLLDIFQPYCLCFSIQLIALLGRCEMFMPQIPIPCGSRHITLFLLQIKPCVLPLDVTSLVVWKSMSSFAFSQVVRCFMSLLKANPVYAKHFFGETLFVTVTRLTIAHCHGIIRCLPVHHQGHTYPIY